MAALRDGEPIRDEEVAVATEAAGVGGREESWRTRRRGLAGGEESEPMEEDWEIRSFFFSFVFAFPV